MFQAHNGINKNYNKRREYNMDKRVLCYTRLPINEKLYDPKLAYSMHLAINERGEGFRALNHNSGVLFALATENSDGSLNPKSIKNPYLFKRKEGDFGVMAIRVEGNGEVDGESKGKVLFFTSKDLIEYQEIGLLELAAEQSINDIFCEYVEEKNKYMIRWENEAGEWYWAETEDIDPMQGITSYEKAGTEVFEHMTSHVATGIEGAVPRNSISVSGDVAKRLVEKLTVPENTGICFPEQVTAESMEELRKKKAIAMYSDGTQAIKNVDWDISGINWSQPGTYEIMGRVHQDHFPFPVAENRADPCIAKWGEKYYFIATNDADNNHTLYIREASSIPQLVEAQEMLILDSNTYEHVGNLLWAPELHEIQGKLYIFHAATPGEFFQEESHVMELKEGGDPVNVAHWSIPRRVVKKDGSDLCEAGKTITLDMTCFQWEGDYYVIWSQRQFLPKDLGAWLYIAKVDPQEPWKLTTDPVILSKPDYGWANNHTFVDEGPFALKGRDKLFITFSSAAVDTSYVVGILSINKGKDLLNPKNWKKGNYPILTSRSVEGEFGTGHNAYVTDDDGLVWNAYHARPGVEGNRSSGIRRVHFDRDGYPVLDLTEEKDLKEEYRNITTSLVIPENKED